MDFNYIKHGHCYIKKGNCIELLKQIPDNSIDLVLTDCPYRVVSGGCTTNTATFRACSGIINRRKNSEYVNKKLVQQGKPFKHNDIQFSEWLPDIYRVLKPITHCYIMVNGRNLTKLMTECEKVGFIYQNLLVWDKGNATPNKYYMNSCEFILMLRKSNAKNINNMGSKTIIKIPNVRNKTHPTEKPVELIEHLILNSTNENDIVLDPFMGSGSTCVASINTNRKCIGYEIDSEYFFTAKQRIENTLIETRKL